MNEYNICGVLVMSNPNKGVIIEDTLNDIEGVEVHAREDNGKMVVTVEGSQSRQIADLITSFTDIDGVISTSLIYHEIDSDEAPLDGAQLDKTLLDKALLENNPSPAEERLQ